MYLASISVARNREQILRFNLLDHCRLPLPELLLLREYPGPYRLTFMVIDVDVAEDKIALPVPFLPRRSAAGRTESRLDDFTAIRFTFIHGEPPILRSENELLSRTLEK